MFSFIRICSSEVFLVCLNTNVRAKKDCQVQCEDVGSDQTLLFDFLFDHSRLERLKIQQY